VSAKPWSVASLVEAHRRVALDADVLIYLLEDSEPRASRAAAIIDAAAAGVVQASISALAHAEVLVGPARGGDAARFERTASELRDIEVDILPVTADIAEDAAWVCGQGSTQLVDAIHLATARGAGTAFITNDRRLRTTPGLEIYHLDDLDLGGSTQDPP
jgi:predicted nucleic acid-binding protein